MSATHSQNVRACLLPGRSCLQISGGDRVSFLQGLITNNVATLKEGAAVFAGLLTPQGKILFDFFVVNAGDAFIIDCASATAAELQKRLGFYKLRAAVAIEDVTASWRVGAAWGEGAAAFAGDAGTLAYPDPRLPGLGWRILLGELDDKTLFAAPPEEYEALRIGLAAPEGGKDYAFGSAFPQEACFDLLNGVDFKKGCFVGQEVVARMKFRGTARTRVFCVEGQGALPEGGADITADGFAVGHLGSVAGNRGVALARLDRVQEALAKGQQLLAGGVSVTLSAPAWASYALDGAAEEAASQ